MHVSFLVRTNYKSELREPGDIVAVPEDLAKRWKDNGIAAIIEDDEEESIRSQSEQTATPPSRKRTNTQKETSAEEGGKILIPDPESASLSPQPAE